MASAYTWEAIGGHAEAAKGSGCHTVAEQDAFIRSRLPIPQESPEKIRTFFEKLFPSQNIGNPNPEEQEQRKQEHENAVNTLIRLGAEYGSITKEPGTRREMGTLYKPERSDADKEYNEHLRETIRKKDYKELGKLYGEHIMDLPSYDPETLEHISDMEAPQAFADLYPLYIAIMEGVKLLSEGTAEAKAITENMSPESKERLAGLVRDMELFSNLKFQCDRIFAPYHQYINANQIAFTEENIGTLYGPPEELSDGMSRELDNYLASLGSSINFSLGAIGRRVELQLENAGIDSKQSVARDFYGKEYDFQTGVDAGCRQVLLRGEPLFCTSGNQLKVYTLEYDKPVEMQPKEAVEFCLEKLLPAAVQKTGSLLNSKTAAPGWLITGSVEYKYMQKAHAEYQKAVKDRPGKAELEDPAAMTALKELGASAQAYFKHKGVNLEKYPDFASFKNNATRQETAFKDMNKRELARMEAAYSALDDYRNTVGSFNMRIDLMSKPAYEKPLALDSLPYNQKVQQTNEAIRTSAFLKEPVAAAGGNTAGENLRQDLNKALTDSQSGLLNKKYFTAQDRQAAENVLAQAVILDMVRSGRKVTNTSPVGIEKAYVVNSQNTIDLIKKDDAFRKAVGNHLTPDGFRNFFVKNRQAGVNKSIATSAAQQQKAAAAEMQKQNQPTFEYKLQAAQPQQQMQPKGGHSIG